ncbi:hypothetical protein CB0940_12262 [Cercospora beticola]|uniref:Uncharacterized protein n=1 Tax=Cercospora beticola TaxID=122368 RepID=A0A2G5H421_CERBT|nr:hypothetical protein CB0940_12262 [Cercospora beticola]PIA87295.1 hypothetical protein CB0940_12262 [Cercospora beticola]CAK1356660.1 unnamed protein product [Cercospora beticola]
MEYHFTREARESANVPGTQLLQKLHSEVLSRRDLPQLLHTDIGSGVKHSGSVPVRCISQLPRPNSSRESRSGQQTAANMTPENQVQTSLAVCARRTFSQPQSDPREAKDVQSHSDKRPDSAA